MSESHFRITKQPEKNGTLFSVFIDDSEAVKLGRSLSTVIMELVARQYVEENYQEIVKHIDQKAIATLTVAQSAAVINETLNKKLPDKVIEIIRKR